MRFLVATAILLLTALGVVAQDGIYCTVSGGQKILGIEKVNSTLEPYKTQFPFMTDFKPAFMIYSGEVHFIVANHFVLGGKGLTFSQEQSAPQYTDNSNMKIFGSMGVGSLGYTVLDGKTNGFRVFPQIGIGVAQTNFQVKRSFPFTTNEDLQTNVLIINNDSLAMINKKELVIDACLAIDWDWSFFPAMACMTGIATRPLFHAEFGYVYVPKENNWMRDSDELNTTQPEITFGGLYYSFGIGFGFTGAE